MSKRTSVELMELKSYEDSRGFMHVLSEDPLFPTKVIKATESKRGVIRGFHVQLQPFLQAKKIYLLKGEIQDVLLEVDSDGRPTGEVKQIILNASDKPMQELFIPNNWAHGYLTLSNISLVLYVCDEAYGNEISLNPLKYFKDWLIESSELIISPKDLM